MESDEFELLETYSSASSAEEIEDHEIPKTRKIKIWKLIKEFSEKDEAINWIKDYKKICFSLWCTTFPGDLNESNWQDASCTCPHYFKQHICKHIIGISARNKLITIPIEAKTIPIGQKRKRVRPAKAKKALEQQYNEMDYQQ